MKRFFSGEISDRTIRVAGTIVGLTIIVLAFLLSLTTDASPMEESWFWRMVGISLPLVGAGALVIAIAARIGGASRQWVPMLAALLCVAFIAIAVRATNVPTLSGQFDTGVWGFLNVAVLSTYSVGLLLVLGTGTRIAACGGLLAAPLLAAVGVALALHDVAGNPFWTDEWVFLGEVDSHIGLAIVLAAASVARLHVIPRPQLRLAGVVSSAAMLVSGLAYGWWFAERVSVDDGWILSLEWTRAVSVAVLILVATDVVRRFEFMAVLALALVVASVVNAVWVAQKTDANQVQVLLYVALAFLTPVALMVFWWLLNDREREPDEAPGRRTPVEPVVSNPA